MGKSIKYIAIFSNGNWPSWIFVLDLFLESSTVFLEATIFVPTKSCHNFFGTSRNSKIIWQALKLLDEVSPRSSKLVSTKVSSSQLQLYTGSLLGFSNLMGLLSVGQTDNLRMIACLTGSVRLRKLSRYTSFTWQSVEHKVVGGASSGKFWLGFSASLAPVLQDDHPRYCHLSLMDLLEYAPKHISISATEPLPTLPRVHCTVPNTRHSNSWNCNGLFPFHCIHSNPCVITRTPFVSSQWCVRPFTATEIARIFDTSVSVEKRLKKSYSTVLPPLHPLLESIPGKILTHALWRTGLCTSQGGIRGFLDNNVR
jgi:hypothetical protein